MPVGPVMNGPVRRLVADVDVDDIPTAPEPPVTIPFTFRVAAPVSEMPDAAPAVTDPDTFSVIAVADDMPTFEAPVILPEILIVGVEVMLIAGAGVAPEPPVTEPVIVRVVPEKLMLLLLAVVSPPTILPLILNDPAVCVIAVLLPPVDEPPAKLPIIIVFPAVEFRAAVVEGLEDIDPNKFPTNVIVPVDDLLIQYKVVVPPRPPPLKLLAVIIKSQAPLWFIVCVFDKPVPLIVANGALIFTVPVVAVTVIKLVALALIPAATLADMLPLLKLNDPPDKFPAPEPVDSVSSISTICGELTTLGVAVIFIL
jgi:hypothetical protein